MKIERLLVGAVAAVAAVVLVTGCAEESDDSTTTTPSTSAPTGPPGTTEQGGAHNAADIAYVQMMITHHEQAIAMAELVPSRSGNPEIVALAQQIEENQAPQIEEMEGWLKAWGAPEPSDEPRATDTGSQGPESPHGGAATGGTSASPTSAPGMGGGEHGMMTAEQMQALEASSGAEFDRLWLESMIAHHRGAVASSQQILTTGASEQVRGLAEQVISTQEQEITRMEALLGG